MHVWCGAFPHNSNIQFLGKIRILPKHCLASKENGLLIYSPSRELTPCSWRLSGRQSRKLVYPGSYNIHIYITVGTLRTGTDINRGLFNVCMWHTKDKLTRMAESFLTFLSSLFPIFLSPSAWT